MKQEKATAVVLVVVGIVVLGLIGLGYYAYKHPIVAEKDREAPQVPDANATSTISIAATTGSVAEADDDDEPRATAAAAAPRRSTATTYQAVSGPAYRNPTYGLTIPGTYQVVPSQNAYAGVPTAASYAFYQNGVYAYTVNVFSKEQWNNIRIQETINTKEGIGPDYLGEGRYLGENKTWIYSYIPGSYMPAGVRFY